MSNELENHIVMPNDKRRRTQLETRHNDESPEDENCSSNSRQASCFISGSSVSSCGTLNPSSSNGKSPNTSNGCILSNNSTLNVNRAALYRNIYDTSSSEDEDEHCVYTYKGAEIGSDLPNSFISLGVNGRNRETTSARSSPEMDFLEMDFDPGPSNEQDSDSDSTSFYRPLFDDNHRNDLRLTSENADRVVQNTDRVVMNEFDNISFEAVDENANCCTNIFIINSEKTVEGCSNLNSEISASEATLGGNPCCSKSLKVDDNAISSNEFTARLFKPITPSHSDVSSDEEIPFVCPSTIKNTTNHQNSELEEAAQNLCDEEIEDSDIEDNTFIPDGFSPIEQLENSNESLFENLCDISLINMKTSANDFVSYDDLLPLDPSYSISAVINVSKLLIDSDCNEKERLANLLQPKLVSECTPLVEYLFMRSVQNANEMDLANFASMISETKLHSRFFSTYPNVDFNLVEWLYSWMRRGAVPVVTRNIQKRGLLATIDIIRNPWRHNVVHKLESPYIHVSNPHEKVLDSVLHSQLSQPSLIYVKRKCILQKWHSKVDLRSLMRANHNRWYNENVLGQVATIIREDDNDSKFTKYVHIPSNCHCGITLFVPSENLTLCREVDDAVELTTTVCH